MRVVSRILCWRTVSCCAAQRQHPGRGHQSCVVERSQVRAAPRGNSCQAYIFSYAGQIVFYWIAGCIGSSKRKRSWTNALEKYWDDELLVSKRISHARLFNRLSSSGFRFIGPPGNLSLVLESEQKKCSGRSQYAKTESQTHAHFIHASMIISLFSQLVKTRIIHWHMHEISIH